MGDDRRRPVDGVDLRHQRRDHQPRLVVQVVVVKLRMAGVQVLAHGVVLPHEERMEEREADPEVAGDTREVDVLLEFDRREPAVVVDPQLAVLPGTESLRERDVTTVDLGAVPPVRIVGDEGGGPGRIGARVAPRALDLHRVVGPRVVVVHLDQPWVLGLVLAMAEPVVDLELDPRAGQEVERRRRLELLPREQLAADRPRVRIEERVRRLRVRVLQRDIPSEAAAEAAHQRIVQVVVRAVQRAGGLVALMRRHVRPVERPAPGVVEVLLPQPVAQPDQHGNRQGQRQLGPADPPIDLFGDAVQERREGHANAPL